VGTTAFRRVSATPKGGNVAFDPEQPGDGGRPPVPGQPQPQAHDPIVLTIGDIGVTRHWVVTPNGTARLAGSQWIGRDMTRTDTRIPPWAIVLAIVFFLACLLGLLFLVVKERTISGHFEVSVTSGTLYHVTQIPVSSDFQIAQIRNLVHQAQSLAASSPA
jgi:hypothetical protein